MTECTPRCPFCFSRKVAAQIDGTYRCHKCGAWYDDKPDEGGDYSDRDPAARIERHERRPQRKG